MGNSVYAIIAIIAYVLGSVPVGYLLVRVARGEDVRASGSGNIGATNVARTGGTKLGVLTLVLDAAKGYLAVFIAERLAKQVFSNADPQPYILAAMSLAVLFAM